MRCRKDWTCSCSSKRKMLQRLHLHHVSYIGKFRIFVCSSAPTSTSTAGLVHHRDSSFVIAKLQNSVSPSCALDLSEIAFPFPPCRRYSFFALEPFPWCSSNLFFSSLAFSVASFIRNSLCTFNTRKTTDNKTTMTAPKKLPLRWRVGGRRVRLTADEMRGEAKHSSILLSRNKLAC
ncbi:hypothetical protein BJ508DRAFT_90235 [Ascobolus immersus RN42]|uniref:Uncharacterized protein n=1 Tax=Ascobolus immersus RN42 TaxID=1160509 RepID=A0A3N4I873_ASCIM|nr:hypothetical protein BJ508DRAFT_90235 [Ascobolus immersus RN42]